MNCHIQVADKQWLLVFTQRNTFIRHVLQDRRSFCLHDRFD